MTLLISAVLFSLLVYFGTTSLLEFLLEKKTLKNRLALAKSGVCESSGKSVEVNDLSVVSLPREKSALLFMIIISLGLAFCWSFFNPLAFYIKFILCLIAAMIFKKALAIYQRKKWRGQVEEGLPAMLDLLQLCVEAGMSMNASLVRVAEENQNSPLSVLFRQTFNEMNHGIPMDTAFQHLGERSKIPDLQFFATAVIQADKLGLSLADSLRNHARLVRETIRMRTREKIQKLPIKMIIPLILFIMPAIFTVVAGPAFLQITQGFIKH